ncbi:RNA polymerase I specific transcription initiation factor domain-containing protein [Hirsutella rhossiliensis]|uniref:RNA polymerase I specific transcription initiation factor domain-containing protein n=1 Tax=Hirsutella rhossiliensis TaxID=111463 RepID=A0A9P8MW97_9HYPO|nr:RNA polymerase I specific transcription initiation factor domain-containing protein [Hirsutella rhossiliensis]KAH0962400.1 RNA polymerase I specific transcription initiation factor domain-containing protein [Hirsutella rhossiliensis]
MERAQPPANWDLESDEIASVTSEDLHANRPNRWSGPESSWRTLTGEERLLWRSMQQLHNEDLALHLYDAFALRRAGRNANTARGLTIGTDDGHDAIWAPPKAWTAWPLKERHVPRETLLKKHEDEDERFTLRKAAPRLPRSALQEELGATILRLAKERFRKRKWGLPVQASAADIAAATASEAELSDDAASLPSSPPMSGHAESGDEDGKMQIDRDSDRGGQDEDDEQPAKRARRTASPTYEPVVSANDDLSYELLDPCVRHIVAQLDRTLTILHNTRVAGVSHLSDSSTDSDSDSQTPRRRSRGRPRRTPQPGDDESALSSPSGSGGPRRRGRPRKLRIPREGETEDEFRVRIARETHRRIPPTQEDKDAAFEEWLRGEDVRRAARAREEAAAAAASEGESNAEAKLRRWGLRDWSDVVGAAALAGFPEDVIKRTAKRCSRLLGEGMLIRRLDETPASRGPDLPTAEFEYRPEPIRPFTSSRPATSCSSAASSSANTDAEDDAQATLQQRRLASLASTPSPRGRGRPGSASSASRSRSRSSAGLAFCPVASCERAATGFARRVNLRRHMHLVHPGRAALADAAPADADADSDDEVRGAVHVDGFLRPIAVARGWRGGDVRRRRAPPGGLGKRAARGRSRVDPDGDEEDDGGGGGGQDGQARQGAAGSNGGDETADDSC